MTLWTDLASYVGPTVNVGGPIGAIRLVVLHIQEGTQAGSIDWCKKPSSQVSAHFFNAKDGTLNQLVDTGQTAWAQAGYNAVALSIENEGNTGDSLTAAQVTNCAKLLARAHQIYGVPLQATDEPTGSGLIGHGLLGVVGGNHPDCPGSPVLAQRGEIVSQAQGILSGGSTGTAGSFPGWPGNYLTYLPGQPAMQGDEVRTWQARMAARGWAITVDGWYGPKSAAVCSAFQRDSTTHGWPLADDAVVGPLTWRASWLRPVSA